MTPESINQVAQSMVAAVKALIGRVKANFESALAAVERRVDTHEQRIAALESLSMMARLDRTLNAPVVPTSYDANGRLVSAQRTTSPGEQLLAMIDERLKAVEARARAVEAKAAAFCYQGVWKPGREYVDGNFVTDHGSVWHANCVTRSRPGLDTDWTLAVKQGDRGKDAR